jgi:hypothetical protein
MVMMTTSGRSGELCLACFYRLSCGHSSFSEFSWHFGSQLGSHLFERNGSLRRSLVRWHDELLEPVSVMTPARTDWIRATTVTIGEPSGNAEFQKLPWFAIFCSCFILIGMSSRRSSPDQPGVPPAVLRFYTVAYCTPCRCRPSGSTRSWHNVRSNGELGVLHAISTPRIGTRFMACNMTPRSGTWRAFRIARHDNAP